MVSTVLFSLIIILYFLYLKLKHFCSYSLFLYSSRVFFYIFCSSFSEFCFSIFITDTFFTFHFTEIMKTFCHIIHFRVYKKLTCRFKRKFQFRVCFRGFALKQYFSLHLPTVFFSFSPC